MYNKLFVLIGVFVLTSCGNSKNSGKLEDNDSLKTYFSDKELKILSDFVENFESQLVSGNDPKLVEDKYIKIFAELETINSIEAYVHGIKKSFGSNNDLISNLIKENFNNKIWYLNEYADNNQTHSNTDLIINLEGEYFKFLKNYAYVCDSDFIKEYAKSIEVAGDISPSSLTVVKYKWKELDLQDEITRLILAIHFVSLSEDEIKYKE